MKLNVIMLVRNEEEYLAKSLKSINDQTLKPDRLIIVDDDSQDETPNIIRRNRRSFYKVIKHKRKPNDQRHAYHRVLRIASHFLEDDVDFIGILDADTLIERHYYEKVIAFMDAHPNIGLCGGVLRGGSNNPRFPAIPVERYVLGANRVYSAECWFLINEGKELNEYFSLAVDSHHYLKAIILGFQPELLQTANSWNLRPQPKARQFFRGYASYWLGYEGWYIILRAIRNYSPNLLAGYLKAFFREEPLPCKDIVRISHINRIKHALGIIPEESKEIPIELVRAYFDSIVKYRQALSDRRI